MKTDMLKNIKAIIFDLDGTLVDSMWMWRTIDIEYLGRFAIALPENLQSCIEGMSFTETAVYFKERFQIPDSIDKMKADWNEMAMDKYRHEVPVKQGLFKFLDTCLASGIKLGIATSNSKELVSAVFEAHHFDQYFSCVITGCEVNKGKPAPDIYLKAAEVLDVSPKDCLVFEDIIPGIQAGLAAGMKVCAVEDTYSANCRNEKKALADYYIEDYNDFF